MSEEREFHDGEVVPGTQYRVIRRIGVGGMGSVYEVEHTVLGKRFVLKALLRELARRDDLVQRLRNEWRALGRLEHPNIVSVTDAGVSSTRVPFYVMERLQGETLGNRLRSQRLLSVREAIDITVQVLSGLSAAHAIGVIHRDVKPPNIFLVDGVSASTVVKLLDFGIAKIKDPKVSQITGRGVTLGTPRYMAPEQASGETVDARTDLYATGLILFEMIAGKGPYDDTPDSNAVFLAQLGKPPPRLSETTPGIVPALDHLVARLLAKHAFRRPSSAAQVIEELYAIERALPRTSRPSYRPADRDATAPGVHTLEIADTALSQRRDAAHTLIVGSDGVARPALQDAVTRTAVGAASHTLRDATPVLFAQVPTRTERLGESSTRDPDEPPTRTAYPGRQPDTPPPVESDPAPAGRRSRGGWLLGLMAGGLVALGSVSFMAWTKARTDPLAEAARDTLRSSASARAEVEEPADAPAVAAVPSGSGGPRITAVEDGAGEEAVSPVVERRQRPSPPPSAQGSRRGGSAKPTARKSLEREAVRVAAPERERPEAVDPGAPPEGRPAPVEARPDPVEARQDPAEARPRPVEPIPLAPHPMPASGL